MQQPSTTRCRPGNLAMIVAADPGTPAHDLGKIVRVVRAGSDWSAFGDCRMHWLCNTLGQRLHVQLDQWAMLSNGREPVEFPDAHLRPIRGPLAGIAQDIAAPKHVEDAAA